VTNRWEHVPLGEVLSRRRDVVVVDDIVSYKRITIRLNGGGIVLRDIRPGAVIGTKTQFRIHANQFVLSKIDARNGAFGVVPEQCDGGIITGNFWAFDPNDERLDVRFLHYLSRTRTFIDFCVRASEGTTNRRYLQEPKFLRQSLKLPLLEEQRRIVRRIDEVTERIEEAKTCRAACEREADAFLRAARRTLIGNHVDATWKPLGELVADIENGWSPACLSTPARPGTWGVIKVGAVSFGTFDPRENKELPQELAPRPDYEIRPGDFLMSRANTRELVGACTLVRDTPAQLLLCDKVFRFVFRDNGPVLPQYLDHALKSPALRQQIELGATGTSPTMKNISKAKILSLRVPAPTVAEQTAIVAKLGEVSHIHNDLRSQQARTLVDLTALQPSIFDRAFSGEW
jgi:type I restriction enzyme S subunit